MDTDYRHEIDRFFDSYMESGRVMDLEHARVLLSRWIGRVKLPPQRSISSSPKLDALIKDTRIKGAGA
jgi:hypothetical protein